jgi:hypothetical protein
MKFALLQCFPALALSVLLLPNAAQSQIQYTDIDPDTTVVSPANMDMFEYFLDIDRDGFDDFRFVHFTPIGDDDNRAVELYFIRGSGDLALLCGQQKQPLALEKGHLISSLSPITTWISASSGQIVGAAFLNRNDRLNEPWEDVTDRYLGIAKEIDGHWHYGWIRLDVPLDASWFTVKDYAINMTAGEEILAGAGTPTTIDQPSTTDIDVDIYGIGKNIVVQFDAMPSSTTQLSIFNTLGARLLNLSLSSIRTQVSMNDFPAGNYIAIVQDGTVHSIAIVQTW